MNLAKADDKYMKLIREFPLIPLKSELHLTQAIRLMKSLIERKDTLTNSEAGYLQVLGDLIAHYEDELVRVDIDLSPQDALKYLMEVNGIVQSQLVEFVGYKSNLSAFLSGSRGLSKQAALKLAGYFKVSPSLFLPKD